MVLKMAYSVNTFDMVRFYDSLEFGVRLKFCCLITRQRLVFELNVGEYIMMIIVELLLFCSIVHSQSMEDRMIQSLVKTIAVNI